ncbi:MAG: hypothetical protein AB1714_20775 [Acidobacteriota bacterium]
MILKALHAIALLGVLTSAVSARPADLSPWESDQVAAQVRSLNIVNQLNLTPAQLDQIIPLAQQDVTERSALVQRREAAEPQLLAAASRLREELKDGFNTTPAAEQEWHRVHGPLLDMFLDYRQHRDERITAAMQVLTPNQLALISRFKPCVVPIKDYRDPARIGQASAGSRIEEGLERLREIPEPLFQRIRPRLHERLSEKLRLHYDPAELTQKVRAFERAVNEVRAMSDLDFEAKKSMIAEELAPAEHAAEGQELRGRTGEFLLSPEGLDVLETKRALVKSGESR